MTQKRKRKLNIAATLALILLLTAVATAMTFSQTPPKPTGVTATTNAQGDVVVSWQPDQAPVHRVGWAHYDDTKAASDAGDWLEAFHFADTKRERNYVIKRLPRNETYWIIVGAANARFLGATWSEWSKTTTPADNKQNAPPWPAMPTTTPAPTHAPSTPAPTHAPSTPAPTHAPSTPTPTHAPSTPTPTHAPSTPTPTHAPSTPAQETQPTIYVVPETAQPGDTVIAYAVSFPTPGAAFGNLTIAGQNVQPFAFANINADGQGAVAFTMPYVNAGQYRLTAQWGKTTAHGTIRVIGETANATPIAPTPTPTPAPQKPSIDVSQLEQAIHALVNEERKQRSARRLEWNGTLAGIAKKHSEDMASRDYVGHRSPEGNGLAERFGAAEHKCVAFGENVALAWAWKNKITRTTQGRSDVTYSWATQSEIARTTVSRWMNSEGHRANILNKEWTSQGIGVALGQSKGTPHAVYVTQNFCEEEGE